MPGREYLGTRLSLPVYPLTPPQIPGMRMLSHHQCIVAPPHYSNACRVPVSISSKVYRCFVAVSKSSHPHFSYTDVVSLPLYCLTPTLILSPTLQLYRCCVTIVSSHLHFNYMFVHVESLSVYLLSISSQYIFSVYLLLSVCH